MTGITATNDGSVRWPGGEFTKAIFCRCFNLLFAFSVNLCAHPYKDSIEAQFFRYSDLLIKKEFAKSTEYLNPAFFKVVPKEQLVNLLEMTYNNPMFNFQFETPTILSIGDINTIDSAHFVKFQYSNYLSMKFVSANERKLDTAVTKQRLQTQFGQNNVTYDANKDMYRIFVIKDVIAKSVDKQNWTFIVVEDKHRPILEKFIPKELF